MSITTITRAPAARESEPVRDLATHAGSYTTVRTTVGEYLASLGLYDPATRTPRWDASIVHVEFQRAALDIKKNAIKKTMLRDMMRGGTVPPTVLAAASDTEEFTRRRLIIDGLQRTHVATMALMSLHRLEQGEDLEGFIQAEIDAIRQLGQRPLSVDGFLGRPFEYQLWRDLEPQELVRLFILLNAGQQKVSPRHLLEVMGAQLRAMFRSWGLPMSTDRENRENPRRRTRRAVESDRPIEGVTHYRYEYLLDGLCAYLTRNQQIKTTTLLHLSAEDAKLSLEDKSVEERITEIGDELCRSDFLWVCRNFNFAMQQCYAGNHQWEYAVMTSDTFTFPLLAALGSARDYEPALPFLEDRKAKLLQILEGAAPDPLALAANDSRHLTGILSQISSNIGRRRRNIVYNAFRQYFRFGAEDSSYPLDWDRAQHV